MLRWGSRADVPLLLLTLARRTVAIRACRCSRAGPYSLRCIYSYHVFTSVQVLEGRADVPVDSAAAAAELIARGDACKRKAPTDLHFLYL